MTDNEEIIFIFRRINSIKDGIRTETHKENAMTRQEAISKIKIRLDVFLDNLRKNKDKVMPWYTTRDIAEVAINALLEGGK